MKKVLVCIDRDGVLIYDKKYHLGKTNDWRSKVKVLPGVVDGLKKLNRISDIGIYMVTNQPGVAVKEFPLLTAKRAHDVCKYILNKLKKSGGRLDGYFVCAHASPAYMKKRKKYHFDKTKICNCSCIKPRLGMVFDALKIEGVTPKNTRVYVIGDRASDIRTAINIKGTGVLIPFENEPGQTEKVKKMHGKKYIAKNFIDATKFIVEDVKKNHKKK